MKLLIKYIIQEIKKYLGIYSPSRVLIGEESLKKMRRNNENTK